MEQKNYQVIYTKDDDNFYVEFHVAKTNKN